VLGESARLKNGQTNRVVGFLSVSTKLDAMNPGQEESVGDLIGRASVGGV
jgi:hypothetical protein